MEKAVRPRYLTTEEVLHRMRGAAQHSHKRLKRADESESESEINISINMSS